MFLQIIGLLFELDVPIPYINIIRNLSGKTLTSWVLWYNYAITAESSKQSMMQSPYSSTGL
jgi:hypothetical protein